MLPSPGKRLEESKKINQSLSALGNVISALTDARGTRGARAVPGLQADADPGGQPRRQLQDHHDVHDIAGA